MKLLFAIIITALSVLAICQQKGPHFPNENDRREVQKLLDGKTSKMQITKSATADLRLLRKKGYVQAVLYKNPWHHFTMIYLTKKGQKVTFEWLNSKNPPPQVSFYRGRVDEIVYVHPRKKSGGSFYGVMSTQPNL